MGNKLNQNPDLAKEIAYRIAEGEHQITMSQFKSKLKEIGYRFDRSMDCVCVGKWLTGPRAGETHPQLTLYPVQIDDGLSFAHVDARRDSNFKKLNEIRRNTFAVTRGCIANF